jgi:MarR family 2-MHQ and catechol resistance regulon transcriptional repressor
LTTQSFHVIILISKHLIWSILMPTHYQGDPMTTLALDTFIKFTRAAGALETRLVRAGNLGDLTMSQFGVLETLHHLGPLCQGALSSKLLKSTGNITLVLDNLEKRGLVRRVRELEDRRMVLISLTSEGEELISRLFPAQAAAIANEMGVLTLAEQETLGKLCRKLGKGRAGSTGDPAENPSFTFDSNL